MRSASWNSGRASSGFDKYFLISAKAGFSNKGLSVSMIRQVNAAGSIGRGDSGRTRSINSKRKERGKGNSRLAAMPWRLHSSSLSHCAIPWVCTTIRSVVKGELSGELPSSPASCSASASSRLLL